MKKTIAILLTFVMIITLSSMVMTGCKDRNGKKADTSDKCKVDSYSGESTPKETHTADIVTIPGENEPDKEDACEEESSTGMETVSKKESVESTPDGYQIGNYITFGSYEQDNNNENGKEAIEWLILDRQEDMVLVISKYALDCKPYHATNTDVIWESSTLRAWLNNDFINSAFSVEEEAKILTVDVASHRNWFHLRVDAGVETQEQIFLLSMDEVSTYFSSENDRNCQPTAYAIANGIPSYYENCSWWLRTPGNDLTRAVNITYYDGGFHSYGDHVNYSNAVRPAMWINLISENYTEENETNHIDLPLLQECQPGDYITFGAYEQDNNKENGKELIDWLVLDKQDGKLLVISKYALDKKAYTDRITSKVGWNTSWEICSLRRWLNNDFINSTFSSAERAMIPTVLVASDQYQDQGVNLSNGTQDRVFLLSLEELNQYFASNEARICQATDYASANNGSDRDNNDCEWWLRSFIMKTRFDAITVEKNGAIHESGKHITYNYAVRPVIWIDLNA